METSTLAHRELIQAPSPLESEIALMQRTLSIANATAGKAMDGNRELLKRISDLTLILSSKDSAYHILAEEYAREHYRAELLLAKLKAARAGKPEPDYIPMGEE